MQRRRTERPTVTKAYRLAGRLSLFLGPLRLGRAAGAQGTPPMLDMTPSVVARSEGGRAAGRPRGALPWQQHRTATRARRPVDGASPGGDLAATSGAWDTVRRVSPKDVAGVFSRPFIVGHFLPAVVALSLLAWVNAALGLPPDLTGKHIGTQLLVIGAAALPLGLLLSNVHAHVVRVFSGEAVERQIVEDRLSVPPGFRRGSGPGRRWVLHRLAAKAAGRFKLWLARRQYAKIKRQRRKWLYWHGQVAAHSSDAKWERFDQEFPYECRRVLPTRLGNAMRAYETYADSRYGLDGAAVWPRIELLLSAEERSLIADARTEVSFALNCAVCLPLVAAWAAGGVVFGSLDLWWLLVAVPGGVLAFSLGRLGAVTATFRAGEPIRAAVDLHRLELYDRLGIRRPSGPDDERALAAAVNRLLLRGSAPPGSARPAVAPGSGREDEPAERSGGPESP